jgi:hypothetical protein
MPNVADPLRSPNMDPALQATAMGLPLEMQRDYLDWLENHPSQAYKRRWRVNTMGIGLVGLALTMAHLILN